MLCIVEASSRLGAERLHRCCVRAQPCGLTSCGEENRAGLALKQSIAEVPPALCARGYRAAKRQEEEEERACSGLFGWLGGRWETRPHLIGKLVRPSLVGAEERARSGSHRLPLAGPLNLRFLHSQTWLGQQTEGRLHWLRAGGLGARRSRSLCSSGRIQPLLGQDGFGCFSLPSWTTIPR